QVTSIDNVLDKPGPPPRAIAREHNGQMLLIVVNEGEGARLGVEIGGLANWNGRQLYEVNSEEMTTVTDGSTIIRLQGHSARVFATNPLLRIRSGG
ncbi:MAG: hypothetical protein KDB23_30300, partial [Planctomycetales bacterium]|nr:hypothetical protein [Planctomycetales bacterium]